MAGQRIDGREMNRAVRLEAMSSPAGIVLAGALALAGAVLAYGPATLSPPSRLDAVPLPLARPDLPLAPTPLTDPRAGATADVLRAVEIATGKTAADTDATTLPADNAAAVERTAAADGPVDGMSPETRVLPELLLPLRRIAAAADPAPYLDLLSDARRSLLDTVARNWTTFGIDLFPSRERVEPTAEAAFRAEEGALAPTPQPAPTAVSRTVSVARGDTLPRVLQKAGVDTDQARDVAQALAGVFNPRKLQAGQPVVVTFQKPHDGGAMTLSEISLEDGVERTVGVTRQPDGFVAHEILHPLDRLMVRSEGRIDDSLYQSALNAGLPQPVLAELIKLYSYDVDFQREIQPGDRFAVFYEGFRDDAGKIAKTGRIVGASMTLSGKELRYYFYRPQGDAEGDYFNARGQSVRKALLRTPIDGARLTSGFGRRTHPILGYSILHKGIDFGAPTGTPIQAAGAGSVDTAGWNKGYGNYVRLRHNGTYQTAYAHMSRIAVKKGQSVRQGQIIGYVGSTGMSTGAHLHYEILVEGKQINPLSVRLPTGRNLEAKELTRFQAEMARIDRERIETPAQNWLAQR